MQETRPPDVATAICKANDTLRRTFMTGNVMMTRGIRAFPDETVQRIFNAIQSFDAFDHNNDPYGEHDFGRVNVDDESICWKIDYFDADLRFASEHPANTALTRRVLTIMLVNEY